MNSSNLKIAENELTNLEKNNLNLKRLVAEISGELEFKNRELKVETALEKVRSIALAMNKTDDMLDVCKTISDQLENLGVTNIRNVQTVIVNKTKGIYHNYQFFTPYNKSIVEDTEYKKHPTVLQMVLEMERAPDAYFNGSFKGDELDVFREYRKQDNQFPDPILDKSNSLYYYFYSIGQGGLGLTTYQELHHDSLEIFKRFHKVFTLAYHRFLDIKRAVAQAKGVQIELALERIRAKTMAMQLSDELAETAVVVFQQLKQLGIAPHRCYIGITNDSGEIEAWSTDEGGSKIMERLSMKSHKTSALTKMYKGWKDGKKSTIIDLFGEELQEHIKVLRKELILPAQGQTYGERRIQALAYFTFGFIGMSSSEPIPEETIKILERFAGVFDQTYTRFLDLEKAEAQAREALIEAALERIRTQAMAMQHSDDLIKSTSILFEELDKLELPLGRCGIGVFDRETRDCELYTTVVNDKGQAELVRGVTSLTAHPMLIQTFECWETQESLQYVLEGKELLDYYKLVSKSEFHLPDKVLKKSASLPKEYYLYTPFGAGGLYVFSDAAPSKKLLKVIRRFADVFHMTYTRYEDLQNAEEQAREAKIEAALERVRAKTMAMHKSEDLTSAVDTVFSELDRLGFKTIRCGIGIFNDTSRKVNVWTASSDNETKTAHVSGDEILEGHPLLEKIYDAWQKQYDFSYLLKGKELLDYYNYTAKSNLPVKAPKHISINTTQYYHCIMFPAGGLFAFRDKEFTQEALLLMKRFSDVFHLAFTRHLDLKHAEEQNKIIQAENERKTQELEEARELQLSMLPKELPQLDNLDIAVYMKTATEVGGDYYDFHVKDDGTLLAVIGDATGHGLKAGTIVTITKSLFHSLAKEKNLLSSFSEISRVIKGMNFRQLSMCLMMLEIKDHHLTISSAAMPPVFVFRSSDQIVEEIGFESVPLGAIKNFPYSLKETTLQKGDTILLFSDGSPELMNESEEMYGYERIKNEFHTIAKNKPNEIVNHLKDSMSDWVNGKNPDDDVTFVVMKVKK